MTVLATALFGAAAAHSGEAMHNATALAMAARSEATATATRLIDVPVHILGCTGEEPSSFPTHK